MQSSNSLFSLIITNYKKIKNKNKNKNKQIIVPSRIFDKSDSQNQRTIDRSKPKGMFDTK